MSPENFNAIEVFCVVFLVNDRTRTFTKTFEVLNDLKQTGLVYHITVLSGQLVPKTVC